MNPIQNKLLQSSACSVGLAALLAAVALASGADGGARLGVLAGTGAAAANALIGALSLAWASARTDRVFYRTFFGGLIAKVAVLGAAFCALARQSAVSPAPALVSLAMATFLF